MTNFNTVPIEDLYESTLQSDLGSTDLVAKTVKIITGTLTGGQTTYMGINYDRPSKYELVEISAINGQDVTILTRALPTKSGGTGTAQNHPAGSKVIITHNYKVFEDIATAIASKANSSAPTIEEPTFTDWVKLPSYANAAARDVAITVPQKDMAVILDNDGDGKRCLTLYSGSAWINITLPGRDVTIDGFLIVAGGYVKFPVYADNTARDAAIPTPAQSMVIYNISAVTLQLYDGANWIDLDIGTPVPLATTSTPGRVRLATDAQVLAGTDDVSGEPLVVQPSQLGLAGVMLCEYEEDLGAGVAVGVVNYLTEGTTKVARAFRTTQGEPVTFPSTVNGGSVFGYYLGGNRFLYRYSETGVANRAVVATVDIDNNTFVIGTPEDVTSGSTGVSNISQIDTDKFVMTYIDSSSPNDVKCKIVDIAGDVVTVGPERTIITLGSAVVYTDLVDISTNKCVLFAYSSATPADTRLISFTVSGDNISPGTDVTVDSDLRNEFSDLIKLDTDKFILIDTNSSPVSAQVGDVSGTTIVLGVEQTQAVTGTNDIQPFYIDTNKIGFVAGAGVLGYIAEISGTTWTVTAASAFNNAVGGVLRISATEFWVSANVGFNVRKITISGTTATLSVLGNETSLFTASPNDGGQATSFIEPRIAVNFVTNNTSSVSFKRNGFADNFIGVTAEAGSRGEMKAVKPNSPVVTNQSGLLGGQYYAITLEGSTLNGAFTLQSGRSASFDRINEQNATFIALNDTMAVKA